MIAVRYRYFSIPSIVVGAVALRNDALNWTPRVRSLTQDPLACTNSPAAVIAAWPRTVIRSRWPRAFTYKTQNPFSALWKVTRSTRPARTSVGVLVLYPCTIARDSTVLPMLESLRGAKIRHSKHRVDQLLLSGIACIARALDPGPHKSMTKRTPEKATAGDSCCSRPRFRQACSGKNPSRLKDDLHHSR